jgi:hypothetical protein
LLEVIYQLQKLGNGKNKQYEEISYCSKLKMLTCRIKCDRAETVLRANQEFQFQVS